MSRHGKLRAFWVQVHLWLGLTLGLVGAFVGLSGSVLVYDHELDALLHPARYATAGATPLLSFGAYAERAARELDGRTRPTGIRLSDDGGPVVVFARDAAGGFQRVYLDPPTGRVLDVGAATDFIGWMHQFHESLQLREYSGRSIVGAIGIAMLISSSSGFYLWWPLRGLDHTAFGFRRGFTTSRNLHYTLGFYGSAVLAMLSFTGIFLAYPDAGRASVAAFGALSPSPRGVEAHESAGRPIDVDTAIDIARALYPRAAVLAVGLPMGQRGAYRINLREEGDAGARPGTVVFVDPRTRAVLQRSDFATRTRGDAFLTAQRVLHEGHWLGPVGRALTFVAGLLPALLVVTGLMIWLRSRSRRHDAKLSATAVLGSDD